MADGNQFALLFGVWSYGMFITNQSGDTCLTSISNFATHSSCPYRDLQWNLIQVIQFLNNDGFEAELRSSCFFMYWMGSIQAEDVASATVQQHIW